MKSREKTAGKPRPIVISSLAARLLGHSREVGSDLSGQRLAITFPAFNSHELANAISELIDKQLFKQRGLEARVTYSLTDIGRNGRVAVA